MHPSFIWTVQVVAYISLTMSEAAQGMPYAYPALSGVSFILTLAVLPFHCSVGVSAEEWYNRRKQVGPGPQIDGWRPRDRFCDFL